MTLEQELAAHPMMRTFTYFALRYWDATKSWSDFEAHLLWDDLSRNGWDLSERTMLGFENSKSKNQ